MFGVILGTGVGGGIVVDGKLLDGANRISGEWGHNPLPYSDASERSLRPCYCGRDGCVETFLSGPGLARSYRLETGRECSPQAIVTEAAAESAANRVLDHYCRQLAQGLAGVINILDPHCIVLGGGLSNIQAIYEWVPHYWKQYVFSDRINTLLKPAQHGDASGVRGAAWLWPMI